MRPAGGREGYKVGQSHPPVPSGFCRSDTATFLPDDDGWRSSSGGTLQRSEEKRKQPPREIQSSHLTVLPLFRTGMSRVSTHRKRIAVCCAC